LWPFGHRHRTLDVGEIIFNGHLLAFRDKRLRPNQARALILLKHPIEDWHVSTGQQKSSQDCQHISTIAANKQLHIVAAMQFP
jgi:hypothetical protein